MSMCEFWHACMYDCDDHNYGDGDIGDRDGDFFYVLPIQ